MSTHMLKSTFLKAKTINSSQIVTATLIYVAVSAFAKSCVNSPSVYCAPILILFSNVTSLRGFPVSASMNRPGSVKLIMRTSGSVISVEINFKSLKLIFRVNEVASDWISWISTIDLSISSSWPSTDT